MDENPLISVIVPIYNTQKYLARCVYSITAQTYQNLEILLVDDGSTDGSGSLCERLSQKDHRIRVFHKENGGSSSARNLALGEAKGKYVGFVDSDDYIDPGFYETLYRAVQEYGVTVSQIGRDEIDEQGRRLPDICRPPREPMLWESRDFLRELILHRGDCSFCTKLFSRELFGDDRFPENKLNEDFYLLVQMLPRIRRLVSLPEQEYHVFYRLGSNSRKADRESFSPVFADCVENADMVGELVDRQYPELSGEAFRFGVFQRLEYLLHIPISQMTGNNEQYLKIVGFLRRNWARAMRNPYLTGKNKLYHTLFALSPRGVRKLHKRLRGKRKTPGEKNRER